MTNEETMLGLSVRSHRGPYPGRKTGAAALAAAFAAASSIAGVIPQGDLAIDLELTAAGLVSPTMITNAGDGSGRLFILDQTGWVWIVQNGVRLPTPFLNISSLLPVLNVGFDERGLLGLAFHPDYKNNGRFFVRYSVPRAGMAGEPCFGTSRGCHSEVLAEFSVSKGDPNIADPTPTVLFTIEEPQFNHNGGAVAFGPDGYLYFTLGDGGGAHDGLADNPPSHGPIGHGQNIETYLGSLLRIDVNVSERGTYDVPPDNPFVGGPGLDEIYAYGLRNPFQFSFDDGPGGDGSMWLSDVGQALFEEVNNPVVAGGNYGWVIMEGSHCFDPFNPTMPPATCDMTGLILPLADYDHSGNGISIIGGYVYRGSASPNLQGIYLCGDFSTAFNMANGHLFYIDTTRGTKTFQRPILGRDNLPLGRFIKSTGRGEDGEIYVGVSIALGPTGSTGEVWRFLQRRCLGDADRSGDVAFADITSVLVHFGNVYLPGTGPGDADSSGVVEFADVTAALVNFALPCD